MTSFDWLTFAVWGVMGAVVGLFWAGLITLALWPFASGLLDTLAQMHGCAGSISADCAIFPQEFR